MWSDIFQHGVKLIECSFSQVRAPSSGHFRKKIEIGDFRCWSKTVFEGKKDLKNPKKFFDQNW